MSTSPASKFQGTSTYVATEDLVVAVNASVALQRPLLVKGEPGTGKTVLAYEVAKSLGQSYSQFRKGLNDLHSSIDYTDSYSPPKSASSSRSSYDDYDDYDEPTAPKFEPPPSEPKVESAPSGEITKPVSEK